jgi:hypothetical protein
MRSSADFDALATYRCFIDEIVSRQNARNAKRIDIGAPNCKFTGPPLVRL